MRASGLVILGCSSVSPVANWRMGIQGPATRTNVQPFGGHECSGGRGLAESRKEMASVMCVLVFPPTGGIHYTMRKLDVIGEDSAIPLLILLVVTVDLVALWLILAK